MRVAAVQFKAREDRSLGLHELVDAVVRAGRDRDLVVCPEMAIAGYAWESTSAVRQVAQGREGPLGRALAEAARECGAWVVCGFPELAGDRVFNSALVIDPAGAVRFVYRKTLLFEADALWASPGDSGYRAFDTDGGRFGVGICMDLNDDRFLAWCAQEKLDGIALPTNWVQEEGAMWDYWRWRLAQGWPEELGVEHGDPNRARVEGVLIGANSYGMEGAYRIRGESAVLSWRALYGAAPESGDGVVRAAW